jgi:outer membrane lipoprotein-sorting protein
MRTTLLLPIFAGTLLAQVQPEALQMMRRSLSALQDFRTGEVETENTAIYQTTSRPLTIKASLVWSAPNKVRLTIGSETAGETSVTDGHMLTTYSKPKHEYSTREGTLPIPVAEGRAFAVPPLASNPNLTSAVIIHDERVSVGNTVFDCAVIEVGIDGNEAVSARRYTLWIDKDTGVTLKLEGGTGPDQDSKGTKSVHSFVVRRLVLNQPIDERAFVFVPPSGAKLLRGAKH